MIRLVTVAFFVVCVRTPSASADWLFVPFLGVKAAGQTNLVDIDQAAGAAKLTLGGSAMLIGERSIGIEIDLGYTPGFFDSPSRGGLVAHSNVTTLTGNVMLTVPASFTRDSLRPYIVAGMGLMHTDIGDRLEIFNVSSNFLAVDVGGGAVGRLTTRTSVRFDLRRFQNLSKGSGRVVGFGPSRLSFWRVTAGLAFRY